VSSELQSHIDEAISRRKGLVSQGAALSSHIEPVSFDSSFKQTRKSPPPEPVIDAIDSAGQQIDDEVEIVDAEQADDLLRSDEVKRDSAHDMIS
jgi:hypothetical protein